MLRAVLDANVFISAVLRPEGPPGQVIERFLRKAAFDTVLSPAIAEEVLRALTYPKLQRFLRRGSDAQLWFEDIVVLADWVAGEIILSGICEDPDDDKYIAAAVEGRAAFLVTGDNKLLKLKAYEGVQIVTPRAFLSIVGG